MATWRLIKHLKFRKLGIPVVLLFCIFLLSGGLGAVNTYVYGAKTLEEYRFNTIAPFFAGFVLVGSFGLMYVYRNRGSSQCLYGFLIVGFCYGGIEVLFKLAGGS